MDKKILLAAGILTLAAVAVAGLSSYGSITGYATVEKGIEMDIMGSSNDEVYDLKKVYQGQDAFSPKIKIKNHVDEEVDLNILFEILPESSGDSEDLEVEIVNEHKNVTLENPVSVPSEDLYFYVKHKFKPDAEIGNYTFSVDFVPV